MTFNKHALLAVLAVLGFAADHASAQPIAPPRRPTFSGYSSLVYPGGGYYGYGGGLGALGYGGGAYGAGYGGFGWGGAGFGGIGGIGANAAFGQQNQQLAQQLAQTNQNLNNLQQFLATGVNPNFPATGHAATFNNLGHWYPSASNGGGGGMSGGMVGGSRMGMGTAGTGYKAPGSGSNTGAAAGGAAGNAPRTAGTGIPVGGARK